MLGVLSLLGNLEEVEGLKEGRRVRTLPLCGLATLRLPPGCCAEANGAKDFFSDVRNPGFITYPLTTAS